MDITALQEKIRRIEGIEAARIVAPNGHIEEIHVLARRSKTPKQLVRDIQSLGYALFDIEIDRRVVSVVQLADSDMEGGIRPALVDVSETVDAATADVTVTMRWEDSLLIGKASGAAAHSTRPRLVAEATLAALRQSIRRGTALGVSSMDVPTLGNRSVAVAQIVLVSKDGEKMLIGAAYIDDDEARAVVRAVLDALNRILTDLKLH